MPQFMDVHRELDGLTGASFEAAHERMVAIQDAAAVRVIRHWFDDHTGTAFCLVEAVDSAAVVRAHRMAHGLIPDEVVEVRAARPH